MSRYASLPVTALCVYEALALTTRRVPPLSALCRRNRWVEALLLAVLLAHLHHAVTGEAA